MGVTTYDPGSVGRQRLGGSYDASAIEFYPSSASGGGDTWHFGKFASGNVTSQGGDVYTAAGTINYDQPGPRGTNMKAIRFRDNAASLTNTGPSKSIGTSDIVVAFYVRHTNENTGAVNTMVDYDITGGTTAGFAIDFTATLFRCALHDGTTLHISQWTHDDVYEDDDWHCIHWIADRTQASLTLLVDGVSKSVANNGNALSSIGSVAPAGGLRWGRRENQDPTDNLWFGGYIAGATLAIGTNSYRIRELPIVG